MPDKKPQGVIVEGIVSARDKQPYCILRFGSERAQMTMAQARNVARDIERMCSRTEADAMILKFFDSNQYPEGAAAAIMFEFREFRSALDKQPVERTETTPSGDKVN